MIERDEFDSQITGLRCGRATLDDLERDHEFAADWDHLRVVLDLGEMGWHHRGARLALAGFRLASVRATFEGGPWKPLVPSANIRLSLPEERSYLTSATVAHLFTHSRFSTDSFYGIEHVHEVHARWIARMIDEHHLYVIPDEDDVAAGFIGFRRLLEGSTQVIDIELVANLAQIPHVGRRLMVGLSHKVANDMVRATTQVYNPGAIGLYRSLGMDQIKTEAILTWSRR